MDINKELLKELYEGLLSESEAKGYVTEDEVLIKLEKTFPDITSEQEAEVLKYLYDSPLNLYGQPLIPDDELGVGRGYRVGRSGKDVFKRYRKDPFAYGGRGKSSGGKSKTG